MGIDKALPRLQYIGDLLRAGPHFLASAGPGSFGMDVGALTFPLDVHRAGKDLQTYREPYRGAVHHHLHAHRRIVARPAARLGGPMRVPGRSVLNIDETETLLTRQPHLRGPDPRRGVIRARRD